MAVQVIKATRSTAPPTTGVPAQDKIRTDCYARVSTGSADQETSYEAQIEHYTNYINAQPNLIFAGAYADEGISGTSLRNMEQFNQMLADCEAGKIQKILTKSISRWARNTVDSLQTIRRLRELGVSVYFEKEGIDTMDNRGELLITVMSSIAQQESDSISKNVRIGIQYLFQQGKGRLNAKQFLGYDKAPDDRHQLVIVPEEAEIVRRIYREFLEGYSYSAIAGHLTQEEIPTPAGKPNWYSSTVDSILENEKYCGDLLTHRIVKNEGALPQYFVEEHHEPIVPKDVFYQVQGERQRRSLYRYVPSKVRAGSKQVLSGRLICGHCGRTLKRCTNPNPLLTDWHCRQRSYQRQSMKKENPRKCPCRTVPEREIKYVILQAFNLLPEKKEELIRRQGALWDGDLKRIDEVLESMREQVSRIAEQLDTMMAEGTESEEAPFLQQELDCMEQERTRLLLERAEVANQEVQIRLLLELVDTMQGAQLETTDTPACYDYEDFFRRTRYTLEDGILEDGQLMSFQNDLVVRFLEKVAVNDEDYEVVFKAGIAVRVPAVKA